jgi:Ala-tRNA(Pro) deacylase
MEDLTRVLDEAGANYELLPHPRTESALAEARALGVDPAEVGKTLVLTVADGYVRAVIPADCRIDLGKVRELVGGAKKDVHLATEDQLKHDYAEFDLGAVPPLGGERSDRVLVDARVAQRDSVVIEAGSHERSVRVPTADLVRLAGASVGDICRDD